MKVGDLVKTNPSMIADRCAFIGVVLDVFPATKHNGWETNRLVILKDDGEITMQRASYNILEVINESR